MERAKIKKDFIDLKDLDNLVPDDIRGNINLLFNKDIPKTPKTPDELLIYRASKLKESDIQQYFYKQFNLLAIKLKQLNKFNELEFVQNDNGDGAAGNLTNTQRMALFSRKKAEGSRKGYPDVSMLVFNQQINLRDAFFLEIKKIGAPSEIHLTKEQLDWFLKLSGMGFPTYITNNPIFFRDVILKEIKTFFK